MNPSALPASRRQVLCGLVVALAAPAGLAACSSDSAGSGGGPTSAPAAAPSGGTGGGSAPSGTPLSQIPVGSGVVVTGANGPVLITQPTAGTVKAYSAVCPHQGATVNPPQAGVIRCPRHGSQFDVNSGAVEKGPAKSGLTTVPTQVVNGTVVLA